MENKANSSCLRLRLLSAPTDAGAGRRGAGMGPEALNVAELADALGRFGVEVEQTQALVGPENPRQPAVAGYRHLSEVVQWCETVFAANYRALQEGCLPVTLGGDHSLAMGSIAAVARFCRERGRRLRVLWLDAHADFNTAELTPSGNLHGMPLACLCGYGPPELVGLGWPKRDRPDVAVEDVRQIGIRSVDDGEKRLLQQVGLEVFDMRYIDEVGMRQTMEQALYGVDEQTHLHVSFDVDFLDPDIAPGVGTPVRGGPNYREAQLCMEMMADTGRVGSLDIVELNPALDERNRSAEVVVDLVESLFGKSTLMRWR